MISPRAGLLLLPASVLLAACGTTTIDHAKLERFVSQRMARVTGVVPRDVSCPSGRKPKAGDVLSCVVYGHDPTRLTARVRQTDDKGNGTLLPLRLVNTRQVQQQVTALLLRNSNVKAKVHCPELTPYAKGRTITCTATAIDGSRPVRVTFTNDAGAFSVAAPTG